MPVPACRSQPAGMIRDAFRSRTLPPTWPHAIGWQIHLKPKEILRSTNGSSKEQQTQVSRLTATGECWCGVRGSRPEGNTTRPQETYPARSYFFASGFQFVIIRRRRCCPPPPRRSWQQSGSTHARAVTCRLSFVTDSHASPAIGLTHARPDALRQVAVKSRDARA